MTTASYAQVQIFFLFLFSTQTTLFAQNTKQIKKTNRINVRIWDTNNNEYSGYYYQPDGTWISSNTTFLSDYPLRRLGLNFQASAEYYFFKNLSINTGLELNIRPNYRFKEMILYPPNYSPITVNSFTVNQSSIYAYIGFGIHL